MALIVFAVAAIVAWITSTTAKGQTNNHVFAYSFKELTTVLASNVFFEGEIQAVQRNATGTGLRFTIHKNTSEKHVLILLSKKGARLLPAAGTINYLNDRDEIIAWSDDLKQGVHLSGDYLLRLPQFGLFDVDPGGKYFLIGAKPFTTWIGEIESPEKRVLLSTNFLGTRIFEMKNQLLVCGAAYQVKNGKINRLTACLIVERDKDGHRITKQLDFPFSGGIIDVDPYSERFLLENNSDMFSRWFVYDVKSAKKAAIGRATDVGLFLTDDLLKKN